MSSNLPIVNILADFTTAPPNLPAAGTAVSLDNGDGRGVNSWSCQRGRQYELGSTQAGTCSIMVKDPQETLNPANTSSPLNSGANLLLPYRAVGVRAYWPRTGNVLNVANYGVTYHPGFEGAGITNGWTSASSGAAISNITAPAPQEGTRSLRLILGGSSATATAWSAGGGYHTVPGLRYTYSAYVRRDAASTGSTISFTAAGQTSSTTTSTTFVRLSVTFTAVTARTLVTMNVTGGPSGSGAQTVYLDAEQLDFGAAATTYVATGPIRYQLFTGYLERYPQRWTAAGYLGVRPLEAVDAISILSGADVTQGYDQEVLADSPVLYLPFDDTASPAQPVEGNARPRSYAATGGTVSWRGQSQPDGSPSVTVTQEVQDPAATPYVQQITAVDSRDYLASVASHLSVNTTGVTLEFWAHSSVGFVHPAMLQEILDGDFYHPEASSVSSAFGVRHFSTGLFFYIRDASVHNAVAANASGVVDGTNRPDDRWHYYAMTIRPRTSDPTVYDIDVTYDATTAEWTRGRPHRAIGINSVQAVASSEYGTRTSKTSIARLAVYPANIGATRRLAHYNRGVGHLGETVAARVTRLLAEWWGGLTSVVGCSDTALAADFGYNTRSVTDVVQEIAATENGLLYVTGDGTLTFEGRHHRYTSQTSVATFGEASASGELPYDSVNYDFDPTYVRSAVSLTRPDGDLAVTGENATSVARYGRRVLSQTLQVTQDFDLEQAGIFYLGRYGDPRLRIEKLTLYPSSNPALWPAVLGAEVSQRVTVKRRTSQGTTISDEYYIESVSHAHDQRASTWVTELELSPVFVPQAWILGDATLSILGAATVPVY